MRRRTRDLYLLFMSGMNRSLHALEQRPACFILHFVSGKGESVAISLCHTKGLESLWRVCVCVVVFLFF